MLKKQTVWLLTMLSLMIVLSVYYMTSQDMEDQAFINEGINQEDDTVTSDSAGTEDDTGVENISNTEQDELYTMLRLEIQDERSMKKGRLKDVVASSSTSADEKTEALNKMDVIDQLATKEVMLEKTILTGDQYENVLVRSDQDKVQVHVKATEELTNKEVVQIMQKARDEFGNTPVNVIYEATTK